MKRSLMLGIFVMATVFGGLCFPQSSDQQAPPSQPDVSLGDYARKLKEQQQKATPPSTKRAKVYSNDDVSTTQGYDVSRTQGAGAYSFTEDPAFMSEDRSVVKISRDGSKEVFDKIILPGPGRDKEFHSHQLYDFQVHKVYTKVLSDPSAPCSVMNFTDPDLGKYDPISGSAALMKELTGGNAQLKQVGTETLNGIPTKVMEVTGKVQVWIAQEGGYPVKVVSIEPDGKAQTMIEIKQLSFAKPPASVFAPPAGCATIQGEVSATGIHAEVPVKFGVGASTSKPTTNVTAVTLQKIPNYTGPCPAHIRVVGTITTDGPGTVYYEFAGNGADLEPEGETITFRAAGTKTVTHVMTFKSEGGSAILIAVGEDSSGHHILPSKDTNPVGFTITCTSGAGK